MSDWDKFLIVMQGNLIILKSLIIPFFLSFIVYSLLMITAQKREKGDTKERN